MIEKVETIDQLETHLSKYVAAYRNSYKICRSAHLSLQILAGRLGYGAVLALVPAVPIFVAIAGALPAGISVVVCKAQLNWLPKFHKTPYKARFIANSSSCTTTELSKLLTCHKIL